MDFIFISHLYFGNLINLYDKNIGDNNIYDVRKDDIRPIETLAGWFEENDFHSEAVGLIEDAYILSRLWIAFRPNGNASRLIHMLYNIYMADGDKSKVIRLLKEQVELLFHNPIPYNVDFPNHLMVQRYKSILKEVNDYDAMGDLERMIKDWPLKDCAVKENTGKYSLIRVYKSGPSAIAVAGRFHFYHLWGFIDGGGTEIIPPQYDEVSYFSEGLAVVGVGRKDKEAAFGRLGVKYGYIDIQGKRKIGLQYDYASPFYNDMALVCKNNVFYYIDKDGCEIKMFHNIK